MARRFGLVLWSCFFLLVALKLAILIASNAGVVTLPEGAESPADAGVFWLELFRTVLISMAAGLIVYAYKVRSAPRVKAVGFVERYFTLFVASMAFGYFLFETPPPSLQVYLVGIALCIVGWTITVWAFVYLSRSFSIMAEVRELVTEGPYRYVRHPLYVGEILNWCGIALLYAGYGVKLYTAVLVALQIVRARVEDRKLALALGERHQHFRSRAGFLWPRFRG